MNKKHVSLFLIFIVIIGLYYYHNDNEYGKENAINISDTALELANTIKPTVSYGRTLYSSLREQLKVNQSLDNCTIYKPYFDLKKLYSNANITIKLYTSEMIDAWLNENYSKYVALLTVYREYVGIRSFVKYPTEDERVVLNVIGDLCRIQYVLENIDTLTLIINNNYNFSLPNNYTFAKIEKILIDKWRNNTKHYSRSYDYKVTYLAAPQSTFNWALYGAWLEVLNCSYLASFNITYEEAHDGIIRIMSDLRKPKNTMLLLMVFYYLEEDLPDIEVQSSIEGSMGSTWRKCINSTVQYKDTPFSEFAFIMYYAWFKNSHIYDFLYVDSSKYG